VRRAKPLLVALAAAALATGGAGTWLAGAANGARTGTEDLSDLYGESTPTVLRFDDDAVYAQTARGGAVLRWDLDTGRRSALGPRERPVTENRPDGSRLAYTLGRGQLVSSSGDRRPERLDVGGRQFVLAGWLDDDRLYGLALDRAPRPTAEVAVCSVPSGRWVAAGPRVPAEDGALPVFATGDFAY
jgi:hypothetical protein